MNPDRHTAWTELQKYVKNEKMLIHSLSSEVVMRALARRLGFDEDEWGLAGLLHDIDVEITNADMHIHGLKSAEILRNIGINEEIIETISMHNETATGKTRNTVFQHALAAGETITGLIYATALVYPDKKLASVKYKSVKKRMKEKAFAASVNRDTIMECEKAGLSLDEFIQISVDAMKEISDDIGL